MTARNALRKTMAVVSACLMAMAFWAAPGRADQYRNAQWYLKSLRIRDAQQISKGAGVIVALVDSGVAAGHPDLQGAVLPGIDVLGDGDGRSDPLGHGTQMAGIIAGRGRGDDRGILGVAPEAKILPVSPASDTVVVAGAINWAVAHGANVISMSFTVAASDDLAAAVTAAADADVILIAGSGNDGKTTTQERYPASYPQVLSVGALDRTGKIAPFSNRGARVGISAPGIDIPVADEHFHSGYAVVDGTSPATAIVAGAAALMRARFPALSARQVVERLTATAVDKGATGRDDAYGYGELDLMAALTAKVGTSPSVSGVDVSGAPVAQAEPADGGTGIPPVLFVGLGIVVLAGVAVAVRRVRRG